jgi:glycosyltransferase involved in cell wall biosynthesis
MAHASQPARVLFLVNGGPESAIAIRARSFASRLEDELQIRIAWRTANKVSSMTRFVWLAIRFHPDLCYVFDMGYSGVMAAGVLAMFGMCRVVVDTGDAIYELSRLSGNRNRTALWLTKQLEQFGLRISRRVVVRSHPHQEYLAQQGITADVIPDGVDPEQFYPQPDSGLRRQYRLEGFTVIGLLGSIIWNPRWQMCYGWELIEVVDRLRHLPVKGLVIGDGSGMPWLQSQCAARGLADRIVLLGRVPYEDLPPLLNVMDICLSTQTNDLAGQVRTTGKLPLYLACGRFVLATRVGEAERVLPTEMLLPYNGTKDTEYPARLAARVQELLEHPATLHNEDLCRQIAQTHFDYQLLTSRLRETIRLAIGGEHR